MVRGGGARALHYTPGAGQLREVYRFLNVRLGVSGR